MRDLFIWTAFVLSTAATGCLAGGYATRGQIGLSMIGVAMILANLLCAEKVERGSWHVMAILAVTWMFVGAVFCGHTSL